LPAEGGQVPAVVPDGTGEGRPIQDGKLPVRQEPAAVHHDVPHVGGPGRIDQMGVGGVEGGPAPISRAVAHAFTITPNALVAHYLAKTKNSRKFLRIADMIFISKWVTSGEENSGSQELKKSWVVKIAWR
jgi:hypothetical protein